jgi:transposase
MTEPREPQDPNKKSELEPLRRMRKDLHDAKTLSVEEARYLVDAYYIMQEDRKRAHNQVRHAVAEPVAEPHSIIMWLADNSAMLEDQIKSALDRYSEAHPVGKWMKEVYGIGPVISAGILAHVDITKAPTVGHIWRYAGLDPTQRWEKKKKRPWNAQLKTLCWKIGQSFMKFSNRDECYYGKLYRLQKAKYEKANAAGEYKERAAQILKEKNFSPAREAYGHYTKGFLPPAQIDAMARRWVVKLFLSHLHGVWHKHHFGVDAPLPYPIAIGGHAHFLPPSHKTEENQ